MIQNTWYIAAHADELRPSGVLGRTVANHPIVFYRAESGEVHGVEDRCPHRLARLSLGEVIGENLRCGYHGATFNPAGKCVSVPGQSRPPEGMGVRKYPVQERYGLIWVWPGDPALSGDESSIPDLLKYGEAPYAFHNGQMLSLKCDYRLIVDNLLDPTHAEFVHRSSFGSSDWQASRSADSADGATEEFTLDMRDDGIDFSYYLPGIVGGPCFGAIYALKYGQKEFREKLDLEMHVNWQPPGLFSYATRMRPRGAPSEEEVWVINLHLLTPETDDTAHYIYRCSALANDHKSDIADFWIQTCRKAFMEDKLVIEAQQAVAGPGDLMSHKLFDLEGDSMSLKGRDVLEAMEAKETGGIAAVA